MFVLFCLFVLFVLKKRKKSPAVEKSIKSDLALLRCRHPNACMTCSVNGNCEFQRLCNKFDCKELLPSETIIHHEERTHGVLDFSSNSVMRDMSKCVLCSRCVRACSDVQGMDILGIVSRGSQTHVTTFNELPLAETACISCGQCTSVCPVGALTEKPHMRSVERLLQNKRDKILVAHVAPAVRIAISEEFDMEPGTVSTGKLVQALRDIGFDHVFDTNFAADGLCACMFCADLLKNLFQVTIVEVGLKRRDRGGFQFVLLGGY